MRANDAPSLRTPFIGAWMKKVAHGTRENTPPHFRFSRGATPLRRLSPSRLACPHRAIERHLTCSPHDAADVTVTAFPGYLVAPPPKFIVWSVHPIFVFVPIVLTVTFAKRGY